MQLAERFVDNVAIVTVTGDITLKKGGDVMLQDQVRRLMEHGHKHVILDLAGVSYVDSAGLGELIRAHAASKNLGGMLKLLKPPRRLHDLMVLTDLVKVFDRFDDEDQALASFEATKSSHS